MRNKEYPEKHIENHRLSALRGRILPGLVFLALVLAFVQTRSNDGAAGEEGPATLGRKTRKETERFNFAVIGDSGTSGKSQKAVAGEMARAHDSDPFDLVLMLGDNIYGIFGRDSFRKRFEEPYQPLLERGVKFYAALGNHDKGKAEAEIRYEKFNMSGRRYYTFTGPSGGGEEYGAQFFALDSTKMDQEQVAWLERELAASQALWKIVFFHHPIYSSGRTHGPNLELRGLLEPLFVKYRVNVVLSGHDHFYERLKPQQGVSYFVSGSAGKIRRGNIDRRSENFLAGNDREHHFMIFKVRGESIEFSAIGETGEVLDRGSIGSPLFKSAGK